MNNLTRVEAITAPTRRFVPDMTDNLRISGKTGIAAGALMLAVPVGFSGCSQADSRPNIIFILTDDMGFGDVSCYGGKFVPTPCIDKMAAEGIRFTQYYSASPISSPSQTGLLTGQHPGRWNITSYLQTKAGNRDAEMADFLYSSVQTLPRTLQAAGYRTAHFGKWHMGGGRDVNNAPSITSYGYDEYASTWESPDPDPLLTASNWRRVPFVVWNGGKIISGGKVDETSAVSALDMFESLCRISGVSLPENFRTDGTDMSKALLGKPQIRTKAIYWEYRRNETVSFPKPDDKDVSPNVAIREDDWKLLINADGSDATLYSIHDDPREKYPLNDKFPDKLKELGEKALTWRKSLPELIID